MNKLIFVNYQNDNDIKNYLDSKLFINEYSYNLFIHKSNVKINDVLIFEVTGNDYKTKKKSLQDIAQNFYCMFMNCSISQLELSIIQNWLTKKSKRFGLYKEFIENGIC